MIPSRVRRLIAPLALAAGTLMPAGLPSQSAVGDPVTGHVSDRAGNPIAHAIVALADLSLETRSGDDGGFQFSVVPRGRHVLVVRFAGYASVVRDVLVAGPTSVDVALEATPFQVEPITVTATRTPLAAQTSPLPTAALSGDALHRAQGVSLAQVLEGLPGLRALTTGAQIGKPVIRGLSGARVLVMENGSRLEDYSWSDEDGPSVETGFVRRVEVVRGPASVLYGSDALGGVVNVISEQVPAPAGDGSRFVRTGLTLSAATNNVELGAAGRAEGATRSFGWRVAGVGRFAGALHTPVGELENTGFGSVNGEAAIGWRGERSALTLRLVQYGGEFKLLEAGGPDTTSGAEDEGPERKLADERLQVAWERRAGAWRFETRLQAQRHSLVEVSDDTVPGGGGATGESEAFNLLLATSTLDLLAHHAAGSALRGTVGVSGLAQWSDASGRIPLIPDARAAAAAAFVFEQLTVGHWTLLGGARLDARRLSADADSALAMNAQLRRANAWSGDIGAVWRPVEALAVSANVGRAWRAPTLFELFANGPHIGEARYEQGDPTLRPEAGTSVDVGVHWTGARVRGEVAAYHHKIHRYIYFTPTALVIDSLPVFQYVQADAELDGGEASIEAQVSRPLVVRLRVDEVRGQNLGAHEPLPLMPPVRSDVGIDWRDRVSLDVETVARQTRANPIDLTTRGYTLLHLAAGSPAVIFGHAVRIDVALRNALNTRYRDFLSRYKAFALEPGRNVILRISTGDVE